MHRIEKYWDKQCDMLSARSLGIFGAILIGLLLYLGCFSSKTIHVFYLIPIALPLAGMVYLPVLRICYAFLMLVTFPVGYTMSYAVLGIVFLLVVTPIALIRRKKMPAGWTVSQAEIDPSKMHE
ncbi:MAG: SxtJ family membrane protein [Bacteroidota bacterium]